MITIMVLMSASMLSPLLEHAPFNTAAVPFDTDMHEGWTYYVFVNTLLGN